MIRGIVVVFLYLYSTVKGSCAGWYKLEMIVAVARTLDHVENLACGPVIRYCYQLAPKAQVSLA